MEIKHVDIKKLVPDPNQPRQEFDQAQMALLEKSIEKQGVLTPLPF
jgi:ParB-like chromosome segregation protein Spo0J